MADGTIRLVVDASNTGQYVDVSTLTVGVTTVTRQRTNLADPTNAAGLAAVKNAAPGAADYGVVVRPVGLPTDGTNTTPAADAKARRQYHQPCDGVNDMLTGSAANLAAQRSENALMTSLPGDWSVTHAPAANTKATTTKAAGSGAVRHVCTGVSARVVGGTTAPAATTVTLSLIDGGTGGTPVLASWTLSLAGVIGAKDEVNLVGLNIVGSAATAMTLEFSAAGGANTFESVNLTGHDCA